MVLLQCDSWSFHTEDPADGRLPHAASPETLKPHHSTGLSWGGGFEDLGFPVVGSGDESAIEGIHVRRTMLDDLSDALLVLTVGL